MAPEGKLNYYEILEIDQHAAQHEVTTAFERAKKTYSGDNPAIYTIFSQEEAREYLKLIEEAYAVLGNKNLRSVYDKKIFGKPSPADLTYDALLRASQNPLPEQKPIEKPKAEKSEAMEKEIRDRIEWSGADIKKVREYKNFAVDRLAQITKINPYYITAIEEMRPSDLPALVFVRGYVVQIAKELGLDSKKVADSYIKAYKPLAEKK